MVDVRHDLSVCLDLHFQVLNSGKNNINLNPVLNIERAHFLQETNVQTARCECPPVHNDIRANVHELRLGV